VNKDYFRMLKLHDLAANGKLLRGGKRQVSVAQMNETLGGLSDLLYSRPNEIFFHLYHHGRQRHNKRVSSSRKAFLKLKEKSKAVKKINSITNVKTNEQSKAQTKSA